MSFVDPDAIGECDARTQGGSIVVTIEPTEDAAGRRPGGPGDTNPHFLVVAGRGGSLSTMPPPVRSLSRPGAQATRGHSEGRTDMTASTEELQETEATSKAPAKVIHLTPAERAALGKAARAKAPRALHAALERPSDRDPLALLQEQDATRVPELVPIKYGRMLVSPFTFYRGAAKIMAHALGANARSGLNA